MRLNSKIMDLVCTQMFDRWRKRPTTTQFFRHYAFDHIMYNRVAPKPCRGLDIIRSGPHKRERQYCNHPMCPCCWYRKASSMWNAILKLGEWEYYYLRQTWLTPWNKDLHPRCVQQFKAYHSAYKMVAYTINFDAPGRHVDDISEKDEWHGELVYQLRGVFVSDRLVKEKYADPGLPDQLEVKVDPRDRSSELVGIIDRAVFEDRQDLFDAWLYGCSDTGFPGLRYPYYYARHPKFSEYLERFSTYSPSGRSWAKIKKIGGHHDREEENNRQAEAGQEYGGC